MLMTTTALSMTGLDGGPVEVDSQAVSTLSMSLDGCLLWPGDAGFDEATQIWNGMITKRPALVVQPASTSDVAHAIRFARANGILLSIKGGGHNVAGTALADGGLTLDMSRMKNVDVDPGRRLARVGPGCLLGDVDRATQAHGLATVLGTASVTGAAGLTLGGGFGYLSRRFGWTVDNLEEVEIVTADGEVRRAACDEHEDLFWALRGGGGNFGVVTRFTYRLHEIGPEVFGGLVLWDGARAAEILTLYRNVSEAAPRELSMILFLRTAPREPFIPEPWRGRRVVGIMACHTGDRSQARRDLAPIRAAGKPIVDRLGPCSYVAVQSMLDRSQPPDGMHNYWKSEFLGRLTDECLVAMGEQAAGIASPASQIIVLQLGGAVADHDAGEAAFGNRDACHAFFALGSWTPDDPGAAGHRAWARSAWKAVRPYSTGGNYVNAQTADEGAERTGQAYGASFDRLRSVKATYDPGNLFRVNRNVSPTGPRPRGATT